jgi:hypothetical protein
MNASIVKVIAQDKARLSVKPNIHQLKAGMRWWGMLPTEVQKMYETEYPKDFRSAADIARFWMKQFPTLAKTFE